MDVFWMYGRSGAGKTSICMCVAEKLRESGRSVVVLDGDVVRAGLCSDLGFDESARTENHRRMAEVAKLVSEQGSIVLVASMAPTVAIRCVIRGILKSVNFIYVSASEPICVQRDPKGLYRRSVGKGNPSEHVFEEPSGGEGHFCIDTEVAGVNASCQLATLHLSDIMAGASVKECMASSQALR